MSTGSAGASNTTTLPTEPTTTAPPIDSSTLIATVRSEVDMMNLSQRDLLRYYGLVSSLVIVETSSFNGYEDQRLYYQRLVDIDDSTIRGLNDEITSNTTVLGVRTNDLRGYQSNSTIYSGQIISTTAAIGSLDIIIGQYDSSLSGLIAEDKALSNYLYSSATVFESSARGYSSLVTTYLLKASAYDTLLSQISTTSSFYDSSMIGYNYSYDVWSKKYSTLSGLDTELSTLVKREQSTITASTVTYSRKVSARKNWDSTIASVKLLSSYYKTALLNQDYARKLSVATAVTGERTSSMEKYNMWVRQYNALLTSRTAAIPLTTTIVQAGGADGTTTLLSTDINTVSTMVGTASNELLQVQARYAAANTAARTAETDFGNASTFTYQSLLDTYDDNISKEMSSLYTYTQIRRVAVEIDIPYYTRVRDDYEQRRVTAVNDSTFFGDAYISSSRGVSTLRRLQAENLSSIDGNSSLIIRLDSEIADLDRVIAENTSSFFGYSTISSLKKIEADIAQGDYDEYTRQYMSVSRAISTLNDDMTNTESSLRGWGLVSTVLLERRVREERYVNVCVRQIDKYATREEAASRQYMASFARMKRLSYQNMYEDAVRTEILRASTLVGDSPNSNLANVLNMNAPDIQSNFTAFSNMQPFLDSFEAVDSNFVRQDSNYIDLDAANALLSTYETNMQDAYLSTVRFPVDANLQTLYQSARTNYTAQTGNVQNIQNRINSLSTTIGGQIVTMNASIRNYFAPTEQFENASTISSMLYSGYTKGYTDSIFSQ